MSSSLFLVRSDLVAQSRLPVVGLASTRVSWSEWCVWISLGIAAACVSALPDMNLRIPGHAILRSVFPMSLGLALAPRRFGGAVMASTGLAAALGLRSTQLADIGFGALTSLVATGFFLDLLVPRLGRGWRVHLSFALAGLFSNGVAFAVQALAKLNRAPRGGGRGFAEWLTQASWTYPLCGLLAGVLSAAVWFQFRSASNSAEESTDSAEKPNG